MYIKKLVLDMNEKLYVTLQAKQRDTDSRYLYFQLVSVGQPYNLTGCSVQLYVVKPDGTKIFNNVPIKKATDGECEALLTSQMLAVAGICECELIIYGIDKATKLSSIPFKLNVIPCLNDESFIESTNEFSALTSLISQVNKVLDSYRTKYQQIETEFTNQKNKWEQAFQTKNTQFDTEFNDLKTRWNSTYQSDLNALKTKFDQLFNSNTTRFDQKFSEVTLNANNLIAEWNAKFKAKYDGLNAEYADQLLNHSHDNKYLQKNAGTVTNFNTCLTENEYQVSSSSSATGAPHGGAIFGKLRVYVSDGGTYAGQGQWIWQVFFSTIYNCMYIRKKINNESWSEWQHTLSMEDVATGSYRTGKIPIIGGDGGMEIGKYIDMHVDANSSTDNDCRILATTDGINVTPQLKVSGRAVGSGSVWNENGWHNMHLGGNLYMTSKVVRSGNTNGGGGVNVSFNFGRTWAGVYSISALSCNNDSGSGGPYTSGYCILQRINTSSGIVGVYGAAANKPTDVYVWAICHT